MDVVWTLVIIFTILIIGLIFISIWQSKNKTEEEKLSIKNRIETIFSVKATHLGGDPNIKQNQLLDFQLRSDGIFCMRILNNAQWGFDYQIIDPKNIIKCECKTEEEISKNVTVTRLLVLGIFAFALKKERKKTNTYMILDYKINNIPVSCIFKSSNGQKISQLVYKINEMIMNNMKAFTSEM